MRVKKVFLFILVLVLLPSLVWGQRGLNVVGTVTDEAGNPLPGANVFIRGLPYGAATNTRGEFSFVVPISVLKGQEAELTAVFIGYKSMTKKITLKPGSVTVNFTLARDVLELESVVVTGMGGTQIKEKLGVTIDKVKAAEIVRADEPNLVAALEAKAPNVEIVKTSGDAGTNAYIRIRGAASIDRSTQPLFVVDGVPIDNSTDILYVPGFGGTYAGSGTESSNRAADLNLEDIESIEILKGPAAAAIYGSRAANGVILITTKSGRPGRTRISYKMQYGRTELSNTIDLQHWYGQGAKGKYSPHSRYSWGPPLNVPDAPWYDPSKPTDKWYNHDMTELSDGGYIFDNTLTISGGNNLTTFYFSLNRYYEKGHWKAGSDYRRISARLKGSHVISEKWKVTASLFYANIYAHYIQRADNLSGIGIAELRTPPDFNNWPYLHPVTGLHRSYRYPEAKVLKKSRGFDNPFWILYEHKNPSRVNRLQGYVKFEYDPTDWLNLSYHVGSDYSIENRYNYLPPGSSRENGKGRLIDADISHHEIDANFLATIQGKKFLKRWDFIDGTLIFGHNLNIRRDRRYVVVGVDAGTPKGFIELDNFVNLTPDQYLAQRNIESYFGQLTLDLFNQLYLTGALRNDGSSTFGKAKKRHWYPKASAAWEFTKKFKIPYVNFGKARFAYGVAGVHPAVYTTISAFQAANEYFGIYTNAILGPTYMGKTVFRHDTNLGNDEIKPERTREFEYGLDLSLFNDRIGIEFTYYDQKSTDVIFDLNVAPSTGSNSITANAATIVNRGIELSITATPIKIRNFTWDTKINWSRNRNKVLDMSGADMEGLGGYSYAIPGYPLGTYRVQSWARFGYGLVLDLDNDGIPETDIDQKYAGQWKKGDVFVKEDGKPVLAPVHLITPYSPNPEWLGSWRNEFRFFRNFTLSVLFDVVYKRWINNYGKGQLYKYGTHADTKVRGQELPINHWLHHGEKAIGPGATNGKGKPFLVDEKWFMTLGGYSGDRWQFIEDGSYVKLREVSLSYRWDSDFVKRLGVQSVDFRIAGRNLITWTNYTGFDPETNRSQATNSRGIDYFNSPQTRAYTFTVRFNY
jgi:TonB-linked SusC/RagA family outer membrane protein